MNTPDIERPLYSHAITEVYEPQSRTSTEYKITFFATVDALGPIEIGAHLQVASNDDAQRLGRLWDNGAFGPLTALNFNEGVTDSAGRAFYLKAARPLPHPRYGFAYVLAALEALASNDPILSTPITLRGIRVHKSMSQETLCFQADLLVGDELAAHVQNEGTGGANNYHPVDRALLNRAHIIAASRHLQHFEALDHVVYDLITEDEERRPILRACKTKTCYKLPSDPKGWYWLDTPFSLKAIAQIREKHPDAVFLNETIAGQTPATEDPLPSNVVRAAKRKTVFRSDPNKPDDYRILDRPFSEEAKRTVLAKYPKAVFVNELVQAQERPKRKANK